MATAASRSPNPFPIPTALINPSRIRSYLMRLPLFTRFVILLATVFWVLELQTVWSVIEWGSLQPSKIGLFSGGLYRLNTFAFIHLGFFHLFFNLVCLIPLLERFESEYGTLVTLALFMGPLAQIPAIIYIIINYSVLGWDTPVVGASMWIFLLLAVESIKTWRSNPTLSIGDIRIPTWIWPAVLCVVTSILISNTSFLGHACGVLIGYAWGLGYIRFLAPPEKVLRWIEGKLNLLGRLPHYVSVDQKTYGRYGVLPTAEGGRPGDHNVPATKPMALVFELCMPSVACDHVNATTISKIKASRKSPPPSHSDFVQYTCIDCPVSGSFAYLGRHFKKSQHEFAISSVSVFCGQCNDLIYHPAITRMPPTVKKRKLAQYHEDEESSIAANTSARPCGREGVRGLFNLGETCYMNAVLQMMVHNPLLASYFLGMGHPVHLCPISRDQDKKNESDSEDDESSTEKPEQKTCVACGMTDVFSDITMADLPGPAHAVNLLFASWKNIPHMSGKQQQDAQEWFIKVVEKLHEAVAPESSNRHHCDCFFHKVFYGRHNSEVTCDKCRTISTTQEEYSFIPLDFKKQARRKKKQSADDVKSKAVIPSVNECLKAYTAAENLSPEQYTCRNCDAPRSANKRVRIRKLPAILCLHVKRFGMKISNGSLMQEKYEGRIDFPLVLDIAPFTTQPKDKSQKFIYDLECVVVHQGDHAHAGHYFAFCKEGGKWFRFDDEIVSATTLEDVMRQEAYLLFYSLRSIGGE
ncbi:hypothetical protein DV737_g800, partial [Chaetothyriales sp. CBS 132003]